MADLSDSQNDSVPGAPLFGTDLAPAESPPAESQGPSAPQKRPGWLGRFVSKLYNWVALMIVVGAVVGHCWPGVGVALQPVAEGFINLAPTFT